MRRGAATALAAALAGCAPPGAAAPFEGQVIGLDGRPAVYADVRLYAIDADPLLGDGGAALIGKTKYALKQAVGSLRTDANGRFTLPPGGPYNVEATQGATIRVLATGVRPADGPLKLSLAYAGTIRGRVTAPGRPEVTDFEGTTVYVPGTGYVATADKAGRFSFDAAAGRFTLVAARAGLGRARNEGVVVEPLQTTVPADMALDGSGAAIAGTTPEVAIAGYPLEVRGSGFEASRGTPFQVLLGGQALTGVERLDDTRLRFTVPAVTSTTELVVSVAGVPSAPWRLPRLVAIGPADPAESLYPGETRPGGVVGVDSDGKVAPRPEASVALEGPFVSGGAVLAAGPAAGSTAQRATLGDLSFSRPIAVVPAGSPRIGPFIGFDAAGAADGKLGAALLGKPAGLAVAADGTLYLGDGEHGRILKATADGTVTTLATGLKNPAGLAIDGRGGLVFVDDDHEQVKRLDLGTHQVAVLAGSGEAGHRDGPGAQARFSDLASVAVGPDGTIFVSEWGNHDVRAIAPGGTVTTLAGGTNGYADGPGARALFSYPDGLACGPDGTLYVADGRNHAIRAIAPDRTVRTLAGSGPRVDDTGGFRDGAAGEAQFFWPRGLARGADGTLYVGDTGNGCLRAVSPAGQVSTLARGGAADPGVATGWFGELVQVAAAPGGKLYVADPKRRMVLRYDPR